MSSTTEDEELERLLHIYSKLASPNNHVGDINIPVSMCRNHLRREVCQTPHVIPERNFDYGRWEWHDAVESSLRTAASEDLAHRRNPQRPRINRYNADTPATFVIHANAPAASLITFGRARPAQPVVESNEKPANKLANISKKSSRYRSRKKSSNVPAVNSFHKKSERKVTQQKHLNQKRLFGKDVRLREFGSAKETADEAEESKELPVSADKDATSVELDNDAKSAELDNDATSADANEESKELPVIAALEQTASSADEPTDNDTTSASKQDTAIEFHCAHPIMQTQCSNRDIEYQSSRLHEYLNTTSDDENTQKTKVATWLKACAHPNVKDTSALEIAEKQNNTVVRNLFDYCAESARKIGQYYDIDGSTIKLLDVVLTTPKPQDYGNTIKHLLSLGGDPFSKRIIKPSPVSVAFTAFANIGNKTMSAYDVAFTNHDTEALDIFNELPTRQVFEYVVKLHEKYEQENVGGPESEDDERHERLQFEKDEIDTIQEYIRKGADILCEFYDSNYLSTRNVLRLYRNHFINFHLEEDEDTDEDEYDRMRIQTRTSTIYE